MYLSCRVKIPDADGKFSPKTINGTTYIYYEYGRVYNKKKKYTEPQRTCIGKRDAEQPDFIYPNEKFLKFFPRELLPIEKDGQYRSGCLHIGAFVVIRKIVSDYHLDEIIARIIGRMQGYSLIWQRIRLYLKTMPDSTIRTTLIITHSLRMICGFTATLRFRIS